MNIVGSDKISIKISTIKHTIIQYTLLKRKSTTSSYEKTIFSLNEKKSIKLTRQRDEQSLARLSETRRLSRKIHYWHNRRGTHHLATKGLNELMFAVQMFALADEAVPLTRTANIGRRPRLGTRDWGLGTRNWG